MKKWIHNEYTAQYGSPKKGYAEDAMKKKWPDISVGSHCDERGTVGGAKGFKRWRVSLTTSSSEVESAQMEDDIHQRGLKAKKNVNQQDLEDFLSGNHRAKCILISLCIVGGGE